MKHALYLALAGILTFGGCGGSSQQEAVQKAAAPKTFAKPSDERRRFPLKNQVKMDLVEQHLLGRDFLPGGNLAEYKLGDRTYRQFLIRAEDANRAAILLFDLKNSLQEARFLAHMGGFFGMDGETPVYCFSKGPFLAGFVGLPEKDADLLAREFAARL
jgi:hypothetical protein